MLSSVITQKRAHAAAAGIGKISRDNLEPRASTWELAGCGTQRESLSLVKNISFNLGPSSWKALVRLKINAALSHKVQPSLCSLAFTHAHVLCVSLKKCALCFTFFAAHTRSCISFQPPPRKVQGERAQSARAFLTQMKDYYDFQFLCVRASLRMGHDEWMFSSLLQLYTFAALCNFYSGFSLFLRPARVVGALRFLYTRATLAHIPSFSPASRRYVCVCFI
jgi:hypothetical protein